MNGVLEASLRLAVPMWMDLYRDTPLDRRITLARECGQVVASQGDTLQYGGKRKFGQGEEEKLRHQQAGRCPGKDCPCADGHVAGHEKRVRDCTRCANLKCYCHVRGEPSYSAGEVFNYLACGLALAAYQPGGVTFGGLRWCASHMQERWTEEDGVICPACLREEQAEATAGAGVLEP